MPRGPQGWGRPPPSDEGSWRSWALPGGALAGQQLTWGRPGPSLGVPVCLSTVAGPRPVSPRLWAVGRGWGIWGEEEGPFGGSCGAGGLGHGEVVSVSAALPLVVSGIPFDSVDETLAMA